MTTIKKTILSPKHNNDEINLSQKIKLPDHNHPQIVHDSHHKPARYEVEEDGIVFNGNHHHHPAPGGVYSLSPEQYNNFKEFGFLAKDPNDVVLFKPVSNNSNSSTSLNQPSWILLKMTLFIILIFNIIKKY